MQYDGGGGGGAMMYNNALHTNNWHGVDTMYNDVMGMCGRKHEPERIVTNC